MIKINYPEPAFRTRGVPGKEEIFDECRRTWVRLTPEEWVRQNFVNWMIKEKKFPATMIVIEKEIMLGELKKRFDVLIFDSLHKPWMMIECKSPEAGLSEKVIMQVLRYNLVVPVPYLVITNGNHCYIASRKNNEAVWLEEFPEWE